MCPPCPELLIDSEPAGSRTHDLSIVNLKPQPAMYQATHDWKNAKFSAAV